MSSLLKSLEREIIVLDTDGVDSYDGPTERQIARLTGILSLGVGGMDPEWASLFTTKQTARFHFAPTAEANEIEVGMNFIFNGMRFEITTVDLSGRLPGNPYTCRLEGVRN